jgi:large subunit ribosomal protein L21
MISGEGVSKIGKPTVAGASVTAEVLGTEKGEKLIVFRFKRRKNVRKKRGHRQTYTQVRIQEVRG